MFSKIRNAAQNKSFYFKLITYTLLVSLLPLLFVSLFIYHNMQTSMKDERHNANSSYLNQTANAVELVIKQIGKSFEQFTMDSSVREYENFPRGSYYEQLNGSLKQEDLPVLERYLNNKKRLLWNLDALKNSNDFIYSVHYIDYTKGIVLKSVGTQNMADISYNEAIRSIPDDIQKYPFFLETKSFKQSEGGFKQVIPVIYKSPNQNNLFMINLDADMIFRKILKKLEKQEEQTAFVLSANGKLLLSDGNQELDRQIAEGIDFGQDAGGTTVVSEGRNVLVTFKKSDVLGWTFVNAVALDDLYKGIANIKRLILSTAFLLVVGTGSLVWFTSRSIYNPISSLVAYIRNTDSSVNKRENADGHFGELKLIRTSLEQAIADRESMRGRLRESLPAYKEKFMLSLIRSNAHNMDEIVERMAFLEMNLQVHDLVLMIVYCEEPRGTKADMESKNINRLRIGDMLERVVADHGKGIVVDMTEGTFSIVVNCGKDNLIDVFSLAGHIRDKVVSLLHISCTIGIGRHCPDIYHMKRAYEEAEEAILYRNMTGEGEIIYIDDVRLQSKSIFVYPKDKEMVLNNYIKNGQTESASGVFADMVKDIKSQEQHMHYRQVQRVFMQLLVSLMENANSYNMELEQIVRAKNNLYSTLLQLKDLDEIIAWFEEVIRKLSGHVDNALKMKTNSHIDEVMKIIEESGGHSISLSIVADRLNLNPSYLSRIFKEKTGVNFLEYLTNFRIEKSKKLLLETSLKLQDICDLLGYNKVNYFIRIFKEVTGTTPGEYRKLYADNAYQPLK